MALLDSIQPSTSEVRHKPSSAMELAVDDTDDSPQQNSARSFQQQYDDEIKKSSQTTTDSDKAEPDRPVTELVEDSTVVPPLQYLEVQTDIPEQQPEQLLPVAGNSLPSLAEEFIPDQEVVTSNKTVTELATETARLTQSLAQPVTNPINNSSQKLTAENLPPQEISLEGLPEAEQPLEAVIKSNVAVKTKDEAQLIKPELNEIARTVKSQTVQLTATTGLISNSDSLTKESSFTVGSQSMQAAVNTPKWGQEFSQRITVMIANNQQVAEMKLNPAQMGSISVRLNVEDDTANITFLTSQTAVKEAIEISLPRLKEQLENQGLSLGDVDVSSSESNETEERESAEDPDGQFTDITETGEQQEVSVREMEWEQGVSVFV